MIDVPLSVLDLAPVAGRRLHRRGARRTPPSWPAAPRSSATAGSGSPSTTTCRASPARRRRCCWPTWPPRRRTIRVGSGGVMLPNHAPLVVAEQFGTLEALHPGRIDLGIGRAPGTDQLTALALRRTMDGLGGRGLPAGAGRPDRLLRAGDRRLPGSSAMPGARRRAGDLAARLERLQRPAGRPARACRSRSRTTSAPPNTRAGAGALPAELPAVALARRAVRDGRGQRGLRRHRRAGRVAGRPGRAVVPAAAPGPPEPMATPEEAAAYPYTRRRSASSWPTAPGRSGARLAGDGPPAADRAARAHPGRRADADHDGLRPSRDRLRSFELVAGS